MNEKYMHHKVVQMLEMFLSRMLRKNEFYKCTQTIHVLFQKSVRKLVAVF